MFFPFDPTFVLLIPVLILSVWAQSKVRSNYARFSRVVSSTRLTGAQMARTILDRNGLHNVEVKPIEGVLTDHYDPRTREVHLSQGVYGSNSIAAVSIAAHECGHALQHAENYAPLAWRSSIVPVANIGSQAAFPLFLLGLILSIGPLMDIGIIFFAAALLFHLVTLPVEYNASHRALKQMENGIVHQEDELAGSRQMLNAAALTYVAAMLMALMNLLRLILIRGSRD